jgi:putative oxidoreductase
MTNWLYPAFWAGRTGLGLLVLRLTFGAAFILHGSGKIVHAFNWMGPDAPVPGILQALAALSEFGGGIGILLGALTPLAALGLLGTMAVAVLMVHVPAGHAFVATGPDQPSYELPLSYFATALLFLLAGPGAYSVDALFFNKKTALSDTQSQATA